MTTRPQPAVQVADFTLQLRRAEAGGGDLLVVLSTKRRFAMYRREFTRDVLFVADGRVGFYVHGTEALAEAIMSIADRGDYERVLLVGGSKAGFGALLVGGVAARMRPDRVIRVLAFQPRAWIWPYQRERKVPSYHRQHRRASKEPGLRADMRRFGDVRFVAELPNLVAQVVYPGRNAEDMEQALALDGPNVRHAAVPTAIHNAMGFLNLIRRPEEEVRAGVDRMFGGDAADDGLFADEAQRLTLVREILAAVALPTVDEYVDATFDLSPTPAPPGWARRMAWRRLRRRAAALLRRLTPYPRIRSPRAAPPVT
ncbi:alpha/beta fold hydrolase [Methylopila henanensis]|uniref:Alpha/beta fold hydrolase n=1 Tax=Methylopila henanensis TaxID=873516 RepID=A0ABW4K6C7_9HYPH